MRAAVFVGIEQPLAIEDVKPSPPGPHDVVVEIGASGVCHSDLSIMRGYVPLPPGMVLGHEGAGRVVEVGKEVTRGEQGRPRRRLVRPRLRRAAGSACTTSRTTASTKRNAMMTPRGTRPDGSPYFCMTGLGTFAETITTSEHSVVKIDGDVPDEQLALIGCGVTTGVGAALNTASGAARARPSPCSAAAASARRSSRARASPARRASSPSITEEMKRRAGEGVRRHRRRRPDAGRCRRAGEGSSPAAAAPTTPSRSSACPETILADLQHGAQRRHGVHRRHEPHRRAGHASPPSSSSSRRRRSSAASTARPRCGATSRASST